MSNFDRRIARLEQALEATDIEDIARMTSEQRGQLMIEILAPYIGEARARAHVHRLRTDPAYLQEELWIINEAAERAGIILRR
jgi:hypothetical protein